MTQHKPITDPQLSDRASPVSFAGPQRQVPLALSVDELPPIDVVFVSHNHYDHLDAPTVRGLTHRSPQARYVVPLGHRQWLIQQGVSPDKVHELDWWGRTHIAGVNFTLVPSQHWSKRSPWDTNEALWGGVVIEDRGWRFMYTGDTGYSPHQSQRSRADHARCPGQARLGRALGERGIDPSRFMVFKNGEGRLLP